MAEKVLTIRLAETSLPFVVAARDLLAAIEQSHYELDDEVWEAAKRLSAAFAADSD